MRRDRYKPGCRVKVVGDLWIARNNRGKLIYRADYERLPIGCRMRVESHIKTESIRVKPDCPISKKAFAKVGSVHMNVSGGFLEDPDNPSRQPIFDLDLTSGLEAHLRELMQ